jgi:hypothetical protein
VFVIGAGFESGTLGSDSSGCLRNWVQHISKLKLYSVISNIRIKRIIKEKNRTQIIYMIIKVKRILSLL